MLGNVCEWTEDNYDVAGKYKVLRGVCGSEEAFASRCAAGVPTGRDYSIGFRCVAEFH